MLIDQLRVGACKLLYISGTPSGTGSRCFFFFSSRRRHTRCSRDWSSDVCSSDLIAEAVSAATGKNFILDPRVRAQVTMFSSTPMSPPAFYEAFLAMLQVHGFIAVPAGDVVKIMPDANARQIPSIDLPDRVSRTSDEIVTQVIDVRNVAAAQLVPVLRPPQPAYAHLAAYPASNILIISDRASNVNRMMRIIQRIDQVGDQDVEIFPLQNAAAGEIVRVINA